MNTKLLSMFAAVVLALSAVSCASDEIADNGTHGGSQASGTLTTFTAQPAASTRTWMNYNDGKFYWEGGDKIWVLDDTNTWRQSSNAATHGATRFDFQVPGTFGAQPNYKVVYHDNTTSGDQVGIAAAQTQPVPGSNPHLAGDHAIATASPTSGGEYGFTLAHKAAYLVFEPYTTTWLSSWKLTKIEVNSDNDIAGTFTINPTTGVLSGSGSKQIMLTVGGSGAYANGFALTNTAPQLALNAAYVVIKPGTHKLRVRFWVKNPADGMEGTITRYYQGTYNPGGYYDLAANLKPKDYSGSDYIPYYMWDAQWQYWAGHEWNKPGYVAGVDQPTAESGIGSAYPQSQTADPNRWYHEGSGSFEGVNGMFNPNNPVHVPNANEQSWYVMKGDPHWDGEELWSSMYHVYRGGMWFKKMSKIQVDAAAQIAAAGGDVKAKGIVSDGNYNDFRTTITYINNTPLDNSTNPIPAADAGNYFFLPAAGNYVSGTFNAPGTVGDYWSSTAAPGMGDNSYRINFANIGSPSLDMYFEPRAFGYAAAPFK